MLHGNKKNNNKKFLHTLQLSWGSLGQEGDQTSQS